jgi:hypothetical protein
MSSAAQDAPITDLPVIDELPDPFRMNDGTRVASVADWRRRREEIAELLLQYEYGRMPPATDDVVLESQTPPEIQNDGMTSFRRLHLKMGPDGDVGMTLHTYLPAETSGPFPVILRIGLGCPIVQEVNERGYAFVAFDHGEIDPDVEGSGVKGPARAAYPEYDWGGLAAWAWGASRALDYLLTCDWVHKDRLIVTGHSRTGKAALLAGGLDERFAMVVPNGSGCGGASCYRVKAGGAETLGLITWKTRFARWFQPDFARFAEHVNRLPFDQHFLKALVAPRLLLTTDALDDTWANPLGNQAAYMAAQPVFDFLSASRHNVMHFREGGHDQLAEDFRVLLDYADWYLDGRPLSREPSPLPYPDYDPELTWRAPESPEK